MPWYSPRNMPSVRFAPTSMYPRRRFVGASPPLMVAVVMRAGLGQRGCDDDGVDASPTRSAVWTRVASLHAERDAHTSLERLGFDSMTSQLSGPVQLATKLRH